MPTLTLTADQILDELRVAGALLEGHFILSSGSRSLATRLVVVQSPTITREQAE